MKNISEACRRIGVSRQHYYDIKNALAEEGIEGLMEKTRKGACLKNRLTQKLKIQFLIIVFTIPLMDRFESLTNSIANTTGRCLTVEFDRSVFEII